MSSRSTQSNYNIEKEESQDDREKLDEEDRAFLADFTPEKMHELERTAYARSLEPCSAAEVAEMMAALGPSDPPTDSVAPAPAPYNDEWLTDFRTLARKHRPFSTTQMVKILRALNAVDDPAVEAGQ
jgi:hypothetical protein